MRLLTGKDSVLSPPVKDKKDMYPAKVKEYARQHWEEKTLPEPSVHRRMKRKERTLREGENAEETLPTRWQHLSANEQYSDFMVVPDKNLHHEHICKHCKNWETALVSV